MPDVFTFFLRVLKIGSRHGLAPKPSLKPPFGLGYGTYSALARVCRWLAKPMGPGGGVLAEGATGIPLPNISRIR